MRKQRTDTSDILHDLESGAYHSFRELDQVPPQGDRACVYTVWRDRRLIYVGISETGDKSRLRSHASGRRSADQFCVYVCDRCVLPTLTASDIQRIANGDLSLDEMTRRYIRDHLTFRVVGIEDGGAARIIERMVKQGALSAGKPELNPA